MYLLLIEDDAELGTNLARALRQGGHTCDLVNCASAADAALACANYDALVLDLGLPDVDGIEWLGRLRRRGQRVPVLILTARDGVEDRIRGLDQGGDDYLAKPFALGELEARLRALARRGTDIGAELRVGNLTLDTAQRVVRAGDEAFDLTARELALLEALMRRSGRVLSKQALFDALYGWDGTANLSMIEVHVSRLRRRLEAVGAKVSIRMLRGLGYRIEARDEG